MISVCIPVYEQSGKGEQYLRELLTSIARQRGVEFEVVVSDNSHDDKLEHLCREFATRFELNYIRNRDSLGVSNNTNFAVAHAKFPLIKIMYQDDLFIDDFALQKFDAVLSKHEWAACNFRSMDNGGRLRQMHCPHWRREILAGKNSIGMPSVVGVRKNGLTFDPNLRVLLDCEYYWLLYQKFGEPFYIGGRPLVGCRYWEGSISRVQGNYNFRAGEYAYLLKKHALA